MAYTKSIKKFETENWENTSGKIDKGFIDFVNEKNPDIQNFLYSANTSDVKYFKDPITGNLIDFSHLSATFSAYLYDTNGFKMAIGSWWKGIPNYTEDDIDNLAGWVGDLQSMVQQDLLIYYDYSMGEEWIGDHYFEESVLNLYTSEYYKELVLKLLADTPQKDDNFNTYILLDGKRIKNSSFKIPDQLADIDAVNLFVNCYRPKDKTTFADCVDRYYSKIGDSRFCEIRYDVFIDNVFSMEEDYTYDSEYFNIRSKFWDGEISSEEFKTSIINLFYEYTLKYTMENAPDGKKWTLYRSAPVTDEVAEGTAKAFAEYIVSNWSW